MLFVWRKDSFRYRTGEILYMGTCDLRNKVIPTPYTLPNRYPYYRGSYPCYQEDDKERQPGTMESGALTIQ